MHQHDSNRKYEKYNSREGRGLGKQWINEMLQASGTTGGQGKQGLWGQQKHKIEGLKRKQLLRDETEMVSRQDMDCKLYLVFISAKFEGLPL